MLKVQFSPVLVFYDGEEYWLTGPIGGSARGWSGRISKFALGNRRDAVLYRLS